MVMGHVTGVSLAAGALRAHVYVVDFGWLEPRWWLCGVLLKALSFVLYFFMSSGAEPCNACPMLSCFLFVTDVQFDDLVCGPLRASRLS